MEIEEFTDVFRKSTEYDALDRKFKLVCNKGIQEVLHYITKFGLNNTAITEHQALSKIAERFPVGTDQLIKMLENTEALSKQEQFCAPHFKSSLPTQPELLEVPKVTGVMIDYFKREGFSLHESLNVHVNVPNTLSLVYKEFREWLTADDYATKEDIFARAWLDGWTEEKKQLYWAVMGVTDYFKCDGQIILFTKEEEAVEVANLIGINTRAEQLERHEHSACVLIDELRATI